MRCAYEVSRNYVPQVDTDDEEDESLLDKIGDQIGSIFDNSDDDDKGVRKMF